MAPRKIVTTPIEAKESLSAMIDLLGKKEAQHYVYYTKSAQIFKELCALKERVNKFIQENPGIEIEEK